jgi:uncharacterized protein YebE (UPF0316 family)
MTLSTFAVRDPTDGRGFQRKRFRRWGFPGFTETVGVALLDATLLGIPILPLFVFLAEVAVVTIGTMRTIFVSRGRKRLAPILGIFEVSIWLFAIGQVMQNLSDVGCFVAFAAGFAAGNYFGILLEKKLAIGDLVVNVISRRDMRGLIESLKLAEYGVTVVAGQGATGPVQVVSTVIKRKELNNVLGIIKGFDGKAFYSVNELQTAASGVFPMPRSRLRAALPAGIRLFRSAA